jgi:hypothetical protein
MARQKKPSSQEDHDKRVALAALEPERRASWLMRPRSESTSGIKAEKPGTFMTIPPFADGWRANRRKPTA